MQNKPIISIFCIIFFIFTSTSKLHAHNNDPRDIRHLEWQTHHISAVKYSGGAKGEKLNIDGKSCVKAPLLSFDVFDKYAYDIDETIEVEIEFDLNSSHEEITLAYDGNGSSDMSTQAQLPQLHNSRWHKQVFILNRARFAGLSPIKNMDFTVSPTIDWTTVASGKVDLEEVLSRTVTICNISLKRNNTIQANFSKGNLALRIFDENGELSPAKIGIYDESGRMPLPNSDAIQVKYFQDLNRVVNLRPNGEYWPVKNRRAFYTDGNYETKLPAGEYKIVVKRGLEYRITNKTINIEKNKTNSVNITLKRWKSMAENGWYSGDVHIHYERMDSQDDKNIIMQSRAEDLNIANILQMGNIGAIYYRQYNWGKQSRHNEHIYNFVPGQEDPRTVSRGHTLHLNITEPTHNPERYYLYHDVFAKTHQQGGITGYAHVRDVAMSSHGMNHRKGMALDVPFGLVDFVEILSWVDAGVSTWFDFLNIGYKLSPAAGTDYPYSGDSLGTVRNYVNIPGDYSVQKWFDGLKEGKTFVTNGPILDLSISGKGMGSEIKVNIGNPVTVRAKAEINPDIDLLDRLELIEQGKVIADTTSEDGSKKLELNYEFQPTHGTWYVLRAYGKRKGRFSQTVAISAPIYIIVDDNGFCKTSEVPSIILNLKNKLKEFTSNTVNEKQEGEPWDMPEKKYWPSQKGMMLEQIEKAEAIYDKISSLAKKQKCL